MTPLAEPTDPIRRISPARSRSPSPKCASKAFPPLPPAIISHLRDPMLSRWGHTQVATTSISIGPTASAHALYWSRFT
jgi:hypothetical protein